ncbi:hypothetical protein AX17_004225 [Amanita inopinata Kibby_2008]|nr:hypothetical protein AX17_004225 [Amanita inopinata Kibby_2008]
MGKRKVTVLEQMADMISQLAALETSDTIDSATIIFPPSEKPNALRERPEVEPIPPLPAPVRGYPTPWVTEFDVLNFVYPLYTRGWGQSLVSWKPPAKSSPARIGIRAQRWADNGEKEQTEDTRERYTMLLSAKYRFQDYDSAVQFFLKVVEVARTENHHPSIQIANGTPFTVTVTTQTDSARRPLWVDEQDLSSSSSPPPPPPPAPPPPEPEPMAIDPTIATEAASDTTSQSHPQPQPQAPPPLRAPSIIPGVTQRDIRLAVLVEKIYQSNYASHIASLGRHIHPTNFRLSWPSMERIWKRQVLMPNKESVRRERRRIWVENLIRKKTEASEAKRAVRATPICFACGEEHHLRSCPKREEIPPRNPCSYCDEMHWSVDCPVRQAQVAERKTKREATREAMRMNAEATEGKGKVVATEEGKPIQVWCNNCGGDHSILDCREPRKVTDVDKEKLAPQL